MVTCVVLTTLTSVGACTNLIHRKCKSFVRLDRDGTERHGTRHEMLYDRLHWLYLVDRDRLCSLLEAKEVAEEDWLLLLVNRLSPLLELLVRAKTSCDLQIGNCLWVPGVLYAVLTIAEETCVVQEAVELLRLESLVVQTDGIAGDVTKTDTADGRVLRTEVLLQHFLGHTDSLEYLRSTIRTDGRDTHLGHDLLQTLVYSLDVVLLCRSVLLLHLVLLHEVVDDGEGHVRVDGRSTVAQQESSVHHLTDFARLYDEGCLHTLAYRDEVVVNGTHSEQ